MKEITRFGSAAKDAIPDLQELIADFNAQCQRGDFPKGELNTRRITAIQSGDASATTHTVLRSIK